MTNEYLEQRHKRRFLEKIEVTRSGCAEWTGSLDRDGYGRFGLWGRWPEIICHRISYTMYVGDIPSGYVIDHICRNRRCVLPQHLRVVSVKENVLENSVSPVAQNNAKTHCKRGHLLAGNNLRLGKLLDRQCRKCSNIRAKEWYASHSEYNYYRNNNKPK